MSSELDVLANYGYGDSVKSISQTLVAAATIAPTTYITFLTGTTAVVTITPPWPGFEGSIVIIWITGSPGATTTAGNLALATTVLINKPVIFTYSQITGKWYASY